LNVTTLNSKADSLRQQMFGGAPGEPPVLTDHPTQSVTTIDGWKSVLFGLMFLLPGVAVVASALNFARTHIEGPPWMIALIGPFFALAGAFLIIHGLRGVARRAAYKRQIAAQPGQPWLADYPWHREGIKFSAFNTMVSRLLQAIGWYVFLLPFFWVGWNVHGMGRVFLFGALFFAVVGLYFWIRWFRMVGLLLRYGNSFLFFDSFPYFMGGQVQARLKAPKHFDTLQELKVTLRCVQEKYVTRGSGEDRNSSVVCYLIYEDSASFTREQIAGASSSYLPISFRLPENQPETHLADTPPTYWEIEAKGKGSSADYVAYFLLPVYRPS
jgi:hypothetical protein